MFEEVREMKKMLNDEIVAMNNEVVAARERYDNELVLRLFNMTVDLEECVSVASELLGSVCEIFVPLGNVTLVFDGNGCVAFKRKHTEATKRIDFFAEGRFDECKEFAEYVNNLGAWIRCDIQFAIMNWRNWRSDFEMKFEEKCVEHMTNVLREATEEHDRLMKMYEIR